MLTQTLISEEGLFVSRFTGVSWFNGEIFSTSWINGEISSMSWFKGEKFSTSSGSSLFKEESVETKQSSLLWVLGVFVASIGVNFEISYKHILHFISLNN